jgi:hypothetical protein
MRNETPSASQVNILRSDSKEHFVHVPTAKRLGLQYELYTPKAPRGQCYTMRVAYQSSCIALFEIFLTAIDCSVRISRPRFTSEIQIIHVVYSQSVNTI